MTKDGKSVYGILSHSHVDRSKPLDSKYFTTAVGEQKANLIMSQRTDDVIIEASGALGLKHRLLSDS
jgi:hypothetical protein